MKRKLVLLEGKKKLMEGMYVAEKDGMYLGDKVIDSSRLPFIRSKSPSKWSTSEISKFLEAVKPLTKDIEQGYMIDYIEALIDQPYVEYKLEGILNNKPLYAWKDELLSALFSSGLLESKRVVLEAKKKLMEGAVVGNPEILNFNTHLIENPYMRMNPTKWSNSDLVDFSRFLKSNYSDPYATLIALLNKDIVKIAIKMKTGMDAKSWFEATEKVGLGPILRSH